MRHYLLIVTISVLLRTMTFSADITIWFGNPGDEPLIVRNNSEMIVPVWIHTKPDVKIAAVHIPLSTDDNFISERLEPVLYSPFNKQLSAPEGFDQGWEVASTMDPVPHEGLEGFTSQSLLGFCDLSGKPNAPLNCPDTCKIMEFPMIISVDDSLLDKTFNILREGFQGRSRGFHFSDLTGTVTFNYEAYYSSIYIVYPGDVNNDHKINKKDIEHLELYFQGQRTIPWPIERADCNYDKVIDIDDVRCLQDMLK